MTETKHVLCTYWGTRIDKKIPGFIRAIFTRDADTFSLHYRDPLGGQEPNYVISDHPLSSIGRILYRPVTATELKKGCRKEIVNAQAKRGWATAVLWVLVAWWITRDNDARAFFALAGISVPVILGGSVAWGLIVAMFRNRKVTSEMIETDLLNESNEIIARLQFTPSDFAELREALSEIEFQEQAWEPEVNDAPSGASNAPPPEGIVEVPDDQFWTCPNCP